MKHLLETTEEELQLGFLEGPFFDEEQVTEFLGRDDWSRPVASWMEDTDMALDDEGQQYGNLDEASAIARAPRKCLVIWCGDHKQTPGGLWKTDEAKAFRRKANCAQR